MPVHETLEAASTLGAYAKDGVTMLAVIALVASGLVAWFGRHNWARLIHLEKKVDEDQKATALTLAEKEKEYNKRLEELHAKSNTQGEKVVQALTLVTVAQENASHIIARNTVALTQNTRMFRTLQRKTGRLFGVLEDDDETDEIPHP